MFEQSVDEFWVFQIPNRRVPLLLFWLSIFLFFELPLAFACFPVASGNLDLVTGFCNSWGMLLIFCTIFVCIYNYTKKNEF